MKASLSNPKWVFDKVELLDRSALIFTFSTALLNQLGLNSGVLANIVAGGRTARLGIVGLYTVSDLSRLGCEDKKERLFGKQVKTWDTIERVNWLVNDVTTGLLFFDAILPLAFGQFSYWVDRICDVTYLSGGTIQIFRVLIGESDDTGKAFADFAFMIPNLFGPGTKVESILGLVSGLQIISGSL